jgi:hypothetical protein
MSEAKGEARSKTTNKRSASEARRRSLNIIVLVVASFLV